MLVSQHNATRTDRGIAVAFAIGKGIFDTVCARMDNGTVFGVVILVPSPIDIHQKQQSWTIGTMGNHICGEIGVVSAFVIICHDRKANV